MYEVIGINGNIIRLDSLNDEEKKKSLTYEISELLTEFGPMRRQLILQFFTEKHTMIVLECINSMLRVGRLYEIDGYITTDQRYFEPESFSVPVVNGKENTFEQTKRRTQFMDDLEWKQKAFAVFLSFRNESGAERWWVNENQKKKWLILSFVAREKLFFIVRIKDFNDLYIYDMMADPHEVRDRLALVGSDEDKKEILSNKVKGVLAFVSVNSNYQVVLKKNDQVILKQ